MYGGFNVNRLIVLLGIGLVFFLFSTLATWYEGAEIVDRPFEWKYSTPFSGSVQKASDISRLDYFVYAVKYKPTFPVVMALSSIYLIITVGYYTLRSKKNVFAIFLSFIAVVLFVLGLKMVSSVTEGAQIISYVLLSCSALCLIAALFQYVRPKVSFLERID
nr:YjdJ family protein [Bacillus sp. RO1]